VRVGILLLAVSAMTARSQSAMREIDDPSTGERWVLSGDRIHPGGPGRWICIAMCAPARATARWNGSQGASAPARALVIHAGDELIIEEHTAVADARLEAVAVGSAASGAGFRARLKIGGKVVEAVALEPGRAVFAPQKGAGQ